MKIAVYTADVGCHDDIWQPVPQDVPPDWEVEFVRFEADLFRRDEYGVWDLRLLRPVNLPLIVPDRLMARWAKCHPMLLFPEADVTIWVDACLEITSPTFVREMVRGCIRESRATAFAFAHPDRATVREEVEAADTLEKYAGNRHHEMVEVFETLLGGEITEPLWAMTVLVRRPDARQAIVDHYVFALTRVWSDQVEGYVALDQIILPYVLDTLDQTMGRIDGNLWENPWFTRHPHRRET